MPVAEELTTPGEWELLASGKTVRAHGSNRRHDWSTYVAEVYDHNPEYRENGRLIAASKDLLALARIVGSAYPNDPGTSDLDDSQPVTISLGVVRQAWAALAKVDR